MTDLLHDELVTLNPAPAAEVPPRLRAAVLAAVAANQAESAHTPPAAAQGARPGTSRSRRARRNGVLRARRRMFPLGLFAALLVTSGALATAVAIHSGAPVPKAVGIGSPVQGPGVPLRGTVHLLSIRAADPAGGLPWGIRTYKTGRDAECWQIGRVLNGQLGQLGVDRALGNDGLFHALPVQEDQCRPVDGAGHLFAFQNTLALLSGVPGTACYAGSTTPLPGCNPRDQRIAWHGFLGPQARSVKVNEGGPTLRISPSDEGAFMWIQRVDVLNRHQRSQTFTATYADGSTRVVDDVMPMESVTNTPPRGAVPPGYVAPERALPTAAKLRSPVRLTRARQGKNLIYQVHFRARVATRRYGVQYLVTLSGGGAGRRCGTPIEFAGFATPGNVRAGQRLTINMSPAIAGRWNRGWCPGTYHGRVIFHDVGHTVGRFRFTVRP